MGTLLRELANLCNPHGKACLCSLFTRCVHRTLHEIFNLTVLATGTEIDVKEAIKLETEGVVGEMIFGATQNDVCVVDIIHPLCKGVGGFEASVAYTSVKFIVPAFRQEFFT
jgi:hypothetical protein